MMGNNVLGALENANVGENGTLPYMFVFQKSLPGNKDIEQSD